MERYAPSDDVLKKYADVLVKFALGDGGVKSGEKVYVQIKESAKPLLPHLMMSILETGASYVIDYVPEGVGRILFENGNEEQLAYFPKNPMLSNVEEMDHYLMIVSSWNPLELDGIDNKKIMSRMSSGSFFAKARKAKEHEGKLTWTIAMYGTEELASIAGLSISEYWKEIIKACHLDSENPIETWMETFTEMNRIKRVLDSLEIEKVRVVGERSDLSLKIGYDRKWLGATGRNIPTFEIFTSPDWRGTEGWMEFSQPLLVYGKIIEGIRLEFSDGKIVSASASKNEDLLKEMISQPNADKLGEFSMTDRRFSRITKFMGTTLYDENVGGEFGNTHVAIGNSFADACKAKMADVEAESAIRGFNISPIHTDIISTYDRTVYATIGNGEEMVIYENGEFTI